MKLLNLGKDRDMMKTRDKVRILSILFFCVLLDIVLHILTSRYSTMPDNPSLSFAAAGIGVEATAALWALLAFSVAAFVYWHVRDTIPGEGVRKGLRYGAIVALLWFLAMLEGVSLFGNPLSKEIVVGLSDAIPVFLLGVLISLVGPMKGSNKYAAVSPIQKYTVISIFTALFAAGRYVAYATGLIKSGLHDMPVETFAWTLLMGIAIGVSFILLGGCPGKSMKQRAVEFSFLIFGMNWAVFLVFMPLIFSGYLLDVLYRIAMDTILVMAATCLAIKSESTFLILESDGKTYVSNTIPL